MMPSTSNNRAMSDGKKSSAKPIPLPETISEKELVNAARRPLPTIGVKARLLLLCAREDLSAAQFEHIRYLCSRIEDWSEFIRQAEFRLIVALVYRHLSKLPVGTVPGDVMSNLRARARRVTCRNLGMMAVHHRLVRDVLDPLGVPHVFFKGPSLAFRYYQEPSVRQFRDIDLLIPRRHMRVVGRRLRETGFKSYPTSEWASDDALAFLQQFIGMMDWVAPEGLLVEMPSSLDGEWDRLPTDEIIAEAEHVSIGNLTIPVISEGDFLCYLCKHHTRHHWARLHWIADLNAILTHPDFDLFAARARARYRGLERTVEAALAIQRATAEPEPWQAKFDDPFAHELFRHCLTNLEGDFEQELALRAAFPATSIDVDPVLRRRHHRLQRNLNRFRPDREDFAQCPLPARWHWLYFLIRPIIWCIRKLPERTESTIDDPSKKIAS